MKTPAAPKEWTAETIAKQVANLLSETCDSFFLVGYTTKGDGIVVKNASTSRDIDALNHVLETIVDRGGVAYAVEPDQDDEDQQ